MVIGTNIAGSVQYQTEIIDVQCKRRTPRDPRSTNLALSKKSENKIRVTQNSFERSMLNVKRINKNRIVKIIRSLKTNVDMVKTSKFKKWFMMVKVKKDEQINFQANLREKKKGKT